MSSEKVLLTGGTGLVGARLREMLRERGYEVAILSRHSREKNGVKQYKWDYTEGFIEEGALQNTQHIIHLAGAGIADGRWTEERKEEILSSRVDSAVFLTKKCSESGIRLKSYISSSAIGIYENSFTLQTEESQLIGNNFLAEVCKKWEHSSSEFAALAERIVIIRTGIVLSTKGGALGKLLPLIRFGLGSPLGSGMQMMSWIHLEDLCRIYIHALENKEVMGVYNAVSTNSVPNSEFTKVAGKVVGMPVWAPKVPSFALQLVFGEMSEVVLSGCNASNTKIKKTGFIFKHDNLAESIKDLLQRKL